MYLNFFYEKGVFGKFIVVFLKVFGWIWDKKWSFNLNKIKIKI